MPPRIELPKGVPLFERLLADLPPTEAKKFDRVDYDPIISVWLLPPEDAERHPLTILRRRLVAGELVATGIFLPIDPHRPRKVIPPELWDNVYIHFAKSELLWGDNKSIIKVRVLSEEENLKLRQSETGQSESKATTDPGRHAPELTEEGVLIVGKERFLFLGPKQMRLIELLVRHSDRGGARIKLLLERAGFSPSITTLDRAFQGNPSWTRLKRYLRREQGLVMLDWAECGKPAASSQNSSDPPL